MRQIVLDTETTGLSPEEGHRIIEIGCVELIDRRLTDHRFHVYINPEREIDEGALEVHGISNEFLASKPSFTEVVDDLIAFIKDAELIIHNAPFDIGFINYELTLLERDYGYLDQYCTVLDTLALARKRHPGQRNGLDALCKRYGIDNSHRELHGALLDAEILADVYLAMTGGQTSLLLEDEEIRPLQVKKGTSLPENRPPLKVIYCNGEELKAHEERLKAIDQASGGKCFWKQLD